MGVSRVFDEAWRWWESCFNFLPYPRYAALAGGVMLLFALGQALKFVFDSRR